MSVNSVRVDFTTDSGGAATKYSEFPVTGFLEHLRYIPDASNPLDTGADITITSEQTGLAIATLTNIGTSAFTLALRQAVHGTTGTAATYDGTRPVLEKIALPGERIKLVCAQGGNAKVGRFDLVFSDFK